MTRIERGIKTLLLASVLFLGACAKDDSGRPSDGPESMPVGTMKISGLQYTFSDGRYYAGHYPYIGRECINLYVECSDGAGVTVEMDRALAGQRIAFEPGDDFWFFAIGNGDGIYLPMQHDDGDMKAEGWFRLECDSTTGDCSLLFEIDRGSRQRWAMGNIGGRFKRVDKI